jgi:solute carrier family 12 (potassium/chloride transporters), member 9
MYSLRVIVFVEYESEVEEERGRVDALLEKLRIEAEVLVFWLASGGISTYETIIHGHFKSSETDTLVNECLKDEDWWDDLKTFRGSRSMTASQEFNSAAHVIESTSGRPGIYNPHSTSAGAADRRRPSWTQLNELPRKPTVSQIVKMGVNMGIHTQNLPVAVFDTSETDAGDGSDSDSDSSDDDFNDTESVVSEGDMEIEPARRPLLAALRRRRSYGDVLTRPKSPQKDRKSKTTYANALQSYGSTSGQDDIEWGREPTKAGGRQGGLETMLERPTLSRQGSTAMRFSSMLVPKTTITSEDDTAKIMFAEAESRPQRPAFSRQSSTARFETREGRNDKTVSFAEPSQGHDQSRSQLASRKSSMSKKSNGGGDLLLDIPELLSSYRFQDDERRDDESGSSYSSQGLPLSFNDLPSRAQHLILNELMRQNSADTAVLFTTLPIPAEGTYKDEEASLTYVSDVEVLCNDLPPVLLVLSNNMTVTVSL